MPSDQGDVHRELARVRNSQCRSEQRQSTVLGTQIREQQEQSAANAKLSPQKADDADPRREHGARPLFTRNEHPGCCLKTT